MNIIAAILFALRALGLTSGDASTDLQRARDIYTQNRYIYDDTNKSIQLEQGFVIIDPNS